MGCRAIRCGGPFHITPLQLPTAGVACAPRPQLSYAPQISTLPPVLNSMKAFAERLIRYRGVQRRGDWAVKQYSILYGDGPIDWPGFDAALQRGVDELPPPDPPAGRPGLAFFIAHQGLTGDYGVLCWWNHENELPMSIWIRRDKADSWRRAEAGESVCVWDLEVIWEERQAWIETMLSGKDPDPDGYLATVPVRFVA